MAFRVRNKRSKRRRQRKRLGGVGSKASRTYSHKLKDEVLATGKPVVHGDWDAWIRSGHADRELGHPLDNPSVPRPKSPKGKRSTVKRGVYRRRKDRRAPRKSVRAAPYRARRPPAHPNLPATMAWLGAQVPLAPSANEIKQARAQHALHEVRQHHQHNRNHPRRPRQSRTRGNIRVPV